MTPQQEKNHQRQQEAIAALSSQSKYQLVTGDHNVFFSREGTKIVIDAINQLLQVQK